MAFFNFDNIKITGIAAAVPKNVVKTESFIDTFGEDVVNKFIDVVGVKETRRTSKHQTTGDLGYTAANKLLEHKKTDRNEVGAVIFASHSPDYMRPSTAFVIHHRLGVSKEAVVFDISLGCSSLVYGIQVIGSLMNSSDIKKALLIVGDTAGKSVNPKDQSSVMLFGETGAAVLLEKCNDAHPINALMRSDGSGYRYMIVPGGGYRNIDASNETIMCKDGNPRTLNNSFIQGTSVFTFTIFDVPKMIKDFWTLTNTTVDDYDSFAFHQANLYILKQIAKKTKIPYEKMPMSIHKYGNTSGASPLISLIDRYSNKRPQKLNTLFAGFGIGLSYGVFSAMIDTADILPIIEDDTIFEEGLIQNPNELYTGLIK